MTEKHRIYMACAVVLIGLICVMPAVAAETGRIVFESMREGNFDIYVMNPDGTEPTRLTDNPAHDTDPTWSSEGSRIAFTSHRDSSSEIYVMNSADGTNVTRLTNNHDGESELAWSPDGSRIAFTRSGIIFVMNADGTNTTPLTHKSGEAGHPSWSPDSSRIAFSSTGDICVMNAKDGTNVTHLTNNTAEESRPAWSPDGTRIAFESNRDGNSEIYVMNADGTNLTRMTERSEVDEAPAWSLDSSLIAFTSYKTSNSHRWISVMNADGTNVTQLTDNIAANNDFMPAWGRAANFTANVTSGDVPLTVTFTDTSTGSPGSWEWTFGDGGTSTDQNPIHTYVVSGSFKVNLTLRSGAGTRGMTKTITVRPTSPPVGSFTADITSGLTPLSVQFTDTSTGLPNSWEWTFGDGTNSTKRNPSHRYSTAGTYTVSLKVSNICGAVTVTRTSFITITPPDPADMGRIAFTSRRDGKPEIYAMDEDGTNVTRLTNTFVGDQEPAWSPDGSRIAFSSLREDGGSDIYVMNADGTGQTLLVSGTGPAWSPDGSRIAFESARTDNFGIYVMNADGTGLTSLTDVYDFSPAWSPDGSRIAFISIRDGDNNYQIYVMNKDGTNVTRLTKNNDINSDPAWSPDGARIAFSSLRKEGGSPEIFLMNADGTNMTRLTDNNASDSEPAWSPDGSRIAFTSYRDGNGEIYVMNTDGHGQTNLTSSGDTDPSWGRVRPSPAVPVANFTANVTTGTIPLTVQFTDTSAGSPNSWEWTFGDGATSTDRNPIHTYVLVGSYTVSLTVKNSEGSRRTTKTWYITIPTSPPDGAFNAYNTYGEAPLTVQFFDISTITLTNMPTGWSWNFGDGTTSIEQNPTHIYTKAGAFTVSMTVSNICGAMTFTRNRYIKVTNSSNVTPPEASETGKILFDNGGEIEVMNGDGTNLTRLSGIDTGPDTDPVWSPDGTRIAFGSGRDGNSEIYVMNADGTGQTRLTNNTATDDSPTWSPDGTRIAFTSNRDENKNEIYVMNADGTNVTRLTNNTAAYDGNPAWSPDGSKIAFISLWSTELDYHSYSEIFVMNPDGTGKTNLSANNTDYDFDPTWSPDGSKIAFLSERDGTPEIYLMNPDGTGQTRMTNNTANDGNPTWSPDGSRIAFGSGGGTYVMNADGTNMTRLTNITCSDLAWSPDSSRIVFAFKFNIHDEESVIYAINTDGTGQTDLTPFSSFDISSLSWRGKVGTTPAVPAATFTANVTNGTAPLTVQFTDTSTGSPNEWSWTFGDGANSTDQNPSHRYAAAGTYTVSLKVGTGAGLVTVTKTRFINVTSPASTELIPIQGLALMPADIDHDGLYEDLNGNGAPDFDDAAIFFNQMDWIASNEPVNAFDFNHNGQIDFNDIVQYFNRL